MPKKKIAIKKSKPATKAKPAVKKPKTAVNYADSTETEAPKTAPKAEVKKKGAAQVKASGRAANRGGAVVIEHDTDIDPSAEKGKSVVIRGGKAVLVEDGEDVG